MNSDSADDMATLEAMGLIYCRAHHKDVPKDKAGLCPSCREAIDATFLRTENCPNGHEINCQDCAIKCQRGEGQMRIREIMRYSAPRMLFLHPIMTVRYLAKKVKAKTDLTNVA